MKQYYIGIDPGQTGAIAFVSYPEIIIHDWSGLKETAQFIGDFSKNNKIISALIEDIQPRPSDSRHLVSFGKLLRNAAQLEGMLAACGIQFGRVNPKTWRKFFTYKYTNNDEIKEISLSNARKIYSEKGGEYFNRKKDHNRAEAALIAYVCEKHFVF